MRRQSSSPHADAMGWRADAMRQQSSSPHAAVRTSYNTPASHNSSDNNIATPSLRTASPLATQQASLATNRAALATTQTFNGSGSGSHYGDLNSNGTNLSSEQLAAFVASLQTPGHDTSDVTATSNHRHGVPSAYDAGDYRLDEQSAADTDFLSQEVEKERLVTQRKLW